MTHRLEPLEEPFTPEVKTILANYPQRDGYLLSLFRVFANSLRFLKKGTVNLLDRDSPVTMREREIVILRVCSNNDCEYEWGVHVSAFSAHAGLSAEQVASTWTGQADDRILGKRIWNEGEALLIRVVDDLCEAGKISDNNYALFQKTWDLAQQLEIMALAGNYHTISFVANSARLDNEAFAANTPRLS